MHRIRQNNMASLIITRLCRVPSLPLPPPSLPLFPSNSYHSSLFPTPVFLPSLPISPRSSSSCQRGMPWATLCWSAVTMRTMTAVWCTVRVRSFRTLAGIAINLWSWWMWTCLHSLLETHLPLVVTSTIFQCEKMSSVFSCFCLFFAPPTLLSPCGWCKKKVLHHSG